MGTVFEAAGGSEGLRRLASAWHRRVMAVLRQVLHDYFSWATTTTMARYPRSADDVPSGLSIPHWSWKGLQL
jgi:hypothetical protein